MVKLEYLLLRKVSDLARDWKKYLIYVLIFYIGLLLPTFSWAYYSKIDYGFKQHEVKNIDQKVFITWFSNHFHPSALSNNEEASFRVFKRISLPDDRITTLMGINVPPVTYRTDPILREGRAIDNQDVKQVRDVCVITSSDADSLDYKLGDKIPLQGVSYEVIGIIGDSEMKGIIYIPISSFEKNVMRGEEEYQFEGIFSCKTGSSCKEFGSQLQEELRRDSISNSRFTEGVDYWKGVTETLNKSLKQQIAISIGGTLFFIINSIIVLLGKMEDEKKNIAIRIVVGASPFTELFSSFMETVLIGFLASFLSLVTVLPIAKLLSLEHLIRVDGITVFGLGFSTLVTITCINVVMFSKFRKIDLPALLNSGE